MKAIFLAPIGWGGTPAWACSPCRQAVEDGIYNQHFATNLLLVLLPFAVLLLCVAGAHFSDGVAARTHDDKGDR